VVLVLVQFHADMNVKSNVSMNHLTIV
jgi:hypothetical protein